MSETEESSVVGLLPSVMLHTLNEMRASAELCDVTLCAGEGRFPAHRAVLAAVSPFFRTVFSSTFDDSKQKELAVAEADEDSLEALLDYIYTARLKTDCDMVSLLLLSEFLQLGSLKCVVAEHLRQHLNVDNVNKVFVAASTLGLEQLGRAATTFLASERGEQCVQVVLVVGGRDSLGDSLRSAECLSHLQGSLRWRHTRPPRPGEVEQPSDTLAVMGQARVEPAFAASSDALYVVGGKQNAGFFLSSLEKFSLTDNRWQHLSPLPVKLSGAAATLANGRLWVTGGRTNQDWTDNVWIYNIEGDRWHQGPRLPEKRIQHAAVSWHNAIYVIGGKTDRDLVATSSVLVLQSGSSHWLTVSPMQRARAQFACTLAHGCVYALGGVDGLHTLADAERYDLTGNHWRTVAPCSVPLEGGRAATISSARGEESVLVVGGSDGAESQNRVERLGVSLGEWHCAPELCTPRSHFGIAVMDV